MKYKRAVVIEEKSDELIPIDEKKTIDVTSRGTMITVRASGNFAGKSFYLDPTYGWVVALDDVGAPILIPMKK